MLRPRTMTTRVVGTLLTVRATTGACAALDEPGSTPTAAPPASTPGPSEDDLVPGWDEPGDGPAPTPAADLTPSQLREMLRLPATGPPTSTTCTDVDVHVTELDVAMGGTEATARVGPFAPVG
ncbi:hypothetical protein IGS67_11215 [Flavimobilis sp. GY10621]|uniref:Secreted protein n=1 Tax=Flavimobilis rhizosphaerae TaxID=2775421 RepID=A0ABR9DSC6_9MICO|nr:hypothetical protein [Flavimobilis rhizosphaerae]MBD9700054.1 hypothetical protein [Flavimobilis rhizosphaerae]